MRPCAGRASLDQRGTADTLAAMPLVGWTDEPRKNSVIIIQNPAPKRSYAELAKRVEQKRAVEQVNLLEAKLNPAFLARLEAAIESADAQQGVQPVFPIEV
ncbi:hypothetical protein [Pseudomonas chlororaphis]|uniref:hypothetical protein n=1 Tax=Pseudomonas chlororaphis TaxID=587753 RepID=UPI001F153682|nr:hypothetical protein [Pseudomonas chlororaphis]